jgi:signal transduction histidine kinase/ActR/RegA family two-component response regulator
MLNLLDNFLAYRIDFALLSLAVVAGVLWAARHLRRRSGGRSLPGSIVAAVAVLTLVGGAVAEWAGQQRTEQLKTDFSGFAQTYAADLAHLGHEDITLETKADDPHYLTLIEAEKRWLKANPLIADIYTFRRDAEGKVRLIVDSETDYDHNGVFDGEREQRTAIGEVYKEATPRFFSALDGHPEFESVVMTDRWGIWVSSFTPLLGRDGKVEGAVGVDYPAATWLTSLAMVRAGALALTLVLVAILLSSATFICLMAGEIEERKAAQARLEEARESALMTSAAKSEFLAVTSHEVRTPLTVIMGFATMLGDTSLNDVQLRYVNTINTAGERLMELVNDVLDFTKIEDGKMVLVEEPWSPSVLVAEALELMAARASDKGINLLFDDRLASRFCVIGDATRIRQILLNLLTNAVKFTHRGSVSVQALWQAAADGRGQLTINVADTGIGIASDKLPLLFQVFSQVNSATTRHYGGSGLGLAICRRLSDLMGATLTVQSALGTGTTFTLSLECVEAKLESQGIISRGEPGDLVPIGVNVRALVVDDQKLNRVLLQHILRRQGCDADLADGGAEAMALMSAQRYDVIFMDLEMPDMDGFATTSALRTSEPAGQHTPIIALTGLTAKGTRERCLQVGMQDYLTKPVYIPALRSALAAVLPVEKRAPEGVAK